MATITFFEPFEIGTEIEAQFDVTSQSIRFAGPNGFFAEYTAAPGSSFRLVTSHDGAFSVAGVIESYRQFKPFSGTELTFAVTGLSLDAGSVVADSDITGDMFLDLFYGGADIFYGSSLDDTIRGLSGADLIQGSSGFDLLHGNEGQDTLRGGAGEDSLFGGRGSDVLRGGADSDTLDGGRGSDLLDGGNGDDLLIGGEGNDTYYVNSDGDAVTEETGGGHDLVYSRLESYRLADNTEDLRLLSSSGLPRERTGTGNQLDNTIFGASQADNNLSGGAGADFLHGRSGSDTVFGNAGSDWLGGRGGHDELSGGRGADTLNGGSGADTLKGGAGSDVLSGAAGRDELSGGRGADTLNGGNGTDTLDGGTGNDVLSGGAGSDELSGNAGADMLSGGGGNDVLRGGAGADTLEGERGNDVLAGNDGNDVLRGNEGADSLDGNAGADMLNGGDGDDTLTGGLGSDVIEGGNGNDLIVAISASAGAGDIIAGGGGPTEETDTDVLDLRGAGAIAVASEDDLEDAGGQRGTVTFEDGSTLEFQGIETILADELLVTPEVTGETAEVDEDSSVTLDVLANDSDPNGDPLEVVAVSASTGDVSINPDGTLTYAPPPDFNGDVTISYTVSDDAGNTANGLVMVAVLPVADAPVAEDDNANTDENTAVTVSVLDNDSDADGDALIVQSAFAENGDVAINSGGTITYTPANGFFGNDTIFYTVTDPSGLTASAQVAVRVDEDVVITPTEFEPMRPGAVSPDGTVDGENTGETMGVGYNDSSGANNGGGDEITDGADNIQGNEGDDIINGGGGADTLTGGLGSDTLTGGAEADEFVFNSFSQSRSGDTNRDVITDFDDALDQIDISSIAVEDAHIVLSLDEGNFDITAQNADLPPDIIIFLDEHADGVLLTAENVSEDPVRALLDADFEVLLLGGHALTSGNFTDIGGDAMGI
ncbi:Ig-like domain-containing protein [Leisingera sp. S232]|uniref:Ig-like domain-containing protein n=1 Tax=Leisingera sp. S232 TaxID=3415132 RepID=UPI003C7B7EF0